MKFRFWGVRGSIPSPGPRTARYGGNTTCIEVRGDDGTLIILDGGTGLFPLAQHLLTTLSQGPISANIFITHSHWDHIHGLPFFTPLFIKGSRHPCSSRTLFRPILPHPFCRNPFWPALNCSFQPNFCSYDSSLDCNCSLRTCALHDLVTKGSQKRMQGIAVLPQSETP